MLPKLGCVAGTGAHPWPKIDLLADFLRMKMQQSKGRTMYRVVNLPFFLKSRAVTARHAKILGRNGPGRAGHAQF